MIGEVVAALCSVHELGLVFGDMKPENIVITESGHVKVTDFGACRPVTPSAKELLHKSRDVLRTLRDGDWRAAAGLPPNPDYTLPLGASGGAASGTESDGSSEDEDAGGGVGEGRGDEGPENRAEGTAAYLAPEVVRDGVIGFPADAWALGCVMFLCLAGRPPIFAETNEAIMARVVRFAPLVDDGGVERDGFARLPRDTAPDAGSLIRSLMEPDPQSRFSVEACARHEFFVESGMDVFSLYRSKPVQLQRGVVAPAPNAAWSRRQNSMIWAPMPHEYRWGWSGVAG